MAMGFCCGCFYGVVRVMEITGLGAWLVSESAADFPQPGFLRIGSTFSIRG